MNIRHAAAAFLLALLSSTASPQEAAPVKTKEREETERLLVYLQPGGDPAAYARANGLRLVRTLRNDPDAHVFTAADIPAARAQVKRGKADPLVRRVFPDARVRRAKYAWVPDDPYYPDNSPPGFPGQWHLGNGAVPGVDVHLSAAWARGLTGSGVAVGIVDDGFDIVHEDLAPNYLPGLSFDYSGNDPDPSPVNSGADEDRHGTSVAGVAVARGGNQIGGTGAAPLAGFAGLRIDFVNGFESDFVDATVAPSLPVKNHSYGYTSPYVDSQAERDALETSTAAGTIHVFAAGNDRGTSNQDSNKTDLQSSPAAITVAAVDSDALFATYSSFGANVFVSAPSNGTALEITTTDRSGAPGYNGFGGDGDPFPDSAYTSTFGGTSSAAPLASGILAVLKQAKPSLNTRFAKHLLVRTSQQLDPNDGTVAGGGTGASGSAWRTNAAGHAFNMNYGFGMIDADALLLEAALWSGVSALTTEPVTTTSVNTAIPDNSSVGVTRTFSLGSPTPLEEVLVTLNVQTTYSGDIEAYLTSPSGTVSRLARAGAGPQPDINWTFSTNAFWGEIPAGTWSLNVRDVQPVDNATWISYSVQARMGQLVAPTGPPTVLAVSRAAPNPTNAASIPFTVVFSENVTGVDASDFVLTTTGSIAGASITGVAGSGAYYAVTVQPGTGAGTIRLDVLDNDTIQDGTPTPLAGAFSAGQSYSVDRLAPTVVNVASTTPNGAYNAGASINVTVNFSEPVTLLGGNLQVTLDTGDVVTIPPFGPANSAAGSYVVGAGDNSPDLQSTLLSLSAGTLRDAVGNDAVLGIPPGQSLADLQALVVDTTPPQILSVSSTTPAGAYAAGASINITVTFNEPVVLTGGSLLVTLDTGDVVAIAPFFLSTTASGTYLVGAGDASPDLDSPPPLGLPAGLLRDAAGNDASLGLNFGGNLAAQEDLLIDTSAPLAGTVRDGASGVDIDAQLSSTTLAATWTGFADAQSGIADFAWAIGTTPGGTQVRAFASVGTRTGTSTSPVDVVLALTPGATYFVTVRATNGAGQSVTASSDGVTITGADAVGPAAPGMFIALPGDGAALLEWTASADAATYRVWWKLAADDWLDAVLIDGLPGLTAVVPGLVNGGAVDFLLKAVDASDNESAGVFATTTPAPPISINGSGFANVAAALGAALPGQTILLGPGSYAGPFTLPPGVSLAGASAGHTFITGGLSVLGNFPADVSTIGSLSITGGAVGVTAGTADVLLDHLVVHHMTSHGAAGAAGGRLRAINCTFVDNGGDGLRALGAGSARNSLFGGNTGIGLNVPPGASSTYNAAFGNGGGNYGAGVTGTGNGSSAALFVDAPGFDYTEATGSPSIDAGDPADAFAAEPDPNGGRINQGAFGNTPWAGRSPPPSGGGGGGGGGGCGLTGLEPLLLFLLRRRRQ